MAIQAIAERMLLLDEKASRFLFWIEKRGNKEDADLSDAIKNLSALGYVNEHLPIFPFLFSSRSANFLFWMVPANPNVLQFHLSLESENVYLSTLY